MKYFSHFKRLFKKHTGVLGIVFSVIIFSVIFVSSRGATPHTAELAYIEHSEFSGIRGSVVPASCDAASIAAGEFPGSHFWGDCSAVCPLPKTGNYDPYFDPGMSTCVTPPVIVVKTQPSNPFLKINSFTVSPSYFSPRGTARFSWNVSGDGVTCVFGGTGVAQYAVPLVGYYDMYHGYFKNEVKHFTATISCTDGLQSKAQSLTATWEGDCSADGCIPF